MRVERKRKCDGGHCGDRRPHPSMGRMESTKIATLRLRMTQKKGILHTERLAMVAAQTKQEPQTDIKSETIVAHHLCAFKSYISNSWTVSQLNTCKEERVVRACLFSCFCIAFSKELEIWVWEGAH